MYQIKLAFATKRSPIQPRCPPCFILAGRRFGSQDVTPGPPAFNQGAPGDQDAKNAKGDSDPNLRSVLLRMFESATTTFASLLVLG